MFRKGRKRFTGGVTHLPLADALHSESKGPLQTSAELEGITADLNDVVDESAHGSQREGGGEEHHVSKLDKHLLVVLESVLGGTTRIITLQHPTRTHGLNATIWQLEKKIDSPQTKSMCKGIKYLLCKTVLHLFMTFWIIT